MGSEYDAQRLGDIVGRLYEQALHADTVSRCGDGLREALGVPSSIMYACDRGTGGLRALMGASDNFEPGALRDYTEHYHAINPWFGTARQPGKAVTKHGGSLIDEASLLRTEFGADWCRRVDIRHMIGSIRLISDDLVVGTGLHRTARQGQFSDADLRLFGWLSDHLCRALQLAEGVGVLEGKTHAGLETLHGLGVCLAVLSGDGRLIFINAAAERLVMENRWFTARGGRLQPVQQKARGTFARTVAGAAATSGGTGLSAGNVLRLPSHEGTLLVTITPFRARALGFGPEQPAAVLRWTDPDRPKGPRENALRLAYGFSPAEARLVVALLEARSPAEHATASGVSINTVRTLLRRIFGKTDTQNQQELILKILSEPAIATV